MIDRISVEKAVSSIDWAHAAAILMTASHDAIDENEEWRLRGMAACASVLGEGVTGPDAAAQLRELIRLADGHLRLASSLIKCIPKTLFAEFALIRHAEVADKVLVEMSTVHPLLETVPDLSWAFQIDPELRRRVHTEPASSFLRRLSPYNRFASDGQKVALHALMTMPEGATLAVALPTGWGKSALFQLGLRRWREFDLTATVVVIVPTVALAQDHARTLAGMPGLEACRALVGGMKPSLREETLGAFVSGDIPILIISPEMAFGGAYQAIRDAAKRAARRYAGAHLAAIVVDEAHIIASWGRYFRPDFQRLPSLVKELRDLQPGLRTLLLSATVDANMRQQLRKDFGGSGPTGEIAVAEPRDEFDIVWSHIPVETDRTSVLIRVADLVPRPAIIYSTTVEDADRLYARLLERGYRRVELYTGDITDPVERERVVESWARGATDLVVATSAFGMGIDKANVRAIIHACLPESAERFYQEIGRGGRDGHQTLSLCLWNDRDASIAASLAIHGWMRSETCIRRWKAIIEEASQKGYFRYDPSGNILLKVPLDARHEGLERITGQLNRQWNAALLTLLQRSGALRIIAEEQASNGAELWVAEILHPTIVDKHSDLEKNLIPFLSVGEAEANIARNRAIELERAVRNREEGCYRTLLFELVESSASPWPCGRCSVCMAAGEKPRGRPDRHNFGILWRDHAWNRPCAINGGAWVINPDEPALLPGLDRLIARLTGVGIEQFVTTVDMMVSLEQIVSKSPADLGFTLILGGDVPPFRVPTAVLVSSVAEDPEAVRKYCMALRHQFETFWKELPLLFVLSSESNSVGSAFSQHLSSQAPMSEKGLVMIGGRA